MVGKKAADLLSKSPSPSLMFVHGLDAPNTEESGPPAGRCLRVGHQPGAATPNGGSWRTQCGAVHRRTETGDKVCSMDAQVLSLFGSTNLTVIRTIITEAQFLAKHFTFPRIFP